MIRTEELPTTEREQLAYLKMCEPVLHGLILRRAGMMAVHRRMKAIASVFTATDTEETVRRAVAEWDALSEAEQRARARPEMEHLDVLIAERGYQDGLTAWIEQPVNEMWVPFPNQLYTRADFNGEVAMRRMQVNRLRSAQTPTAALWRRHHPTWRPKLMPHDDDRFDEVVSDSLTRVGDYFAAHPATQK